MPTPLLVQFLLCPAVLVSLLWVTAPYGRHFKPGWGVRLPNRAAWFAMELPAVLVIAWTVFSTPTSTRPAAWVPLALWQFHYLYRAFLFPLWMRPSNRTFPASLVLFAIAFNVLNGYNNGTALLWNAANGAGFPGFNFWLGAVVFLCGFALHAHSDHVIRSLRAPGESGYAIPHGGLFRWVSSPNYLGEIIQWAGWAVLTWSLAGVAFALFTACNLLPRALSNHAWYRERFPEYPRGRKALIPGLL